MKYSGVIFDFNGTLFWDTPLHNKAWNMFLEKRGMHLSDHEFFATFHGKNNRDIFKSLFQREHSAEEIRALVDEKETLYRQLCLETEMMLAPGAPDFLDRIVYNNGQIKGKPDPQIYRIAMSVIGKQPDEVIVFEDAVAGLQAAKNADAGCIIAVNSNNDDYSDWADYLIIRNFDEADRNLIV